MQQMAATTKKEAGWRVLLDSLFPSPFGVIQLRWLKSPASSSFRSEEFGGGFTPIFSPLFLPPLFAKPISPSSSFSEQEGRKNRRWRRLSVLSCYVGRLGSATTPPPLSPQKLFPGETRRKGGLRGKKENNAALLDLHTLWEHKREERGRESGPNVVF